MAIVELSNVHLWRGSRQILNGLDWRIESGQHWALIGANGAGKTSLLRILTGYLWPSEGCVKVLGNVFGEAHIPDLRKTIGWVSSSIQTHLDGQLTALEVVLAGLDAAMGVYREFTPAEKRTAQEALDRTGIPDLAGQAYRTLSQGEQQRVLLARGLVHRPRLLILDEPCAGLDPAARMRLLADVGWMIRQKNCLTLLLVTHHIEEIGPWISHVAVMKSGAFVALDTPENALTDELLSEAFGHACRVERSSDGFAMRFVRSPS